MKQFAVLVIAVVVSAKSVAADLTYLECKLPSITTELLLTLNEGTGKVSQTYKVDGTGFTAEAQFNPNEIIYRNDNPRVGVKEQFTIDRKTLQISHAFSVSGLEGSDKKDSGLCKVVKPEKNKV